MNQVPVMMQNPAYAEEVELNEYEVDPADLPPSASGDSPTSPFQTWRMRM